MTLFFTPVSNPRDRYFISYGLDGAAQQHGAEIYNTSNGVIAVEVRSLAPNTLYYFKVRAGNECQPGDWGNTLSARTGQRSPTYRFAAVPRVIISEVARRIVPAKPAARQNPAETPSQPPQPSPAIPVLEPTETPAPRQAPPTPEVKIPAHSPVSQPQSASLVDRFLGFVKRLFN